MPARRSRPLPALLALLALLAAALVAACGSTDQPASASADSVALSATDDACQAARTDLAAGSTTFTVTNDGAKETEVYVYAPQGGAFTKVVGEVEDIGPGTSRDLTVDLAPGRYELACKPGQTGNGIRQQLTVS